MITAKAVLNQLSYKQQLQSEEWKNFSRGVKEQTNFCESCRQRNPPLDVHHLFYEPDRMLWEYQRNEVVVLCRECHDLLHAELKKFRKYVFAYLNPQCFKILNGCLAVGLTQYKPLVYLHALAEFTGNENLVNNHAKAWGFEKATTKK